MKDKNGKKIVSPLDTLNRGKRKRHSVQRLVMRDRVKSAIEALDANAAGELSDGAALVAISLLLRPQPKLTKEEIAYGKQLAKAHNDEALPRGGAERTPNAS